MTAAAREGTSSLFVVLRLQRPVAALPHGFARPTALEFQVDIRSNGLQAPKAVSAWTTRIAIALVLGCPPMISPSVLGWHYRLRVDIHPTDAGVLRDALDGEPFGLIRHLGEEEVRRMIDSFALDVDAQSAERWDDFEGDISILSVYLSQTEIVGHEIHARADGLSAWRIVGRRGETIRFDLSPSWDEQEGAIVLGDEDVKALEARWSDLPEWARASLARKFPELGR
jgi:hypothetical protein